MKSESYSTSIVCTQHIEHEQITLLQVYFEIGLLNMWEYFVTITFRSDDINVLPTNFDFNFFLLIIIKIL